MQQVAALNIEVNTPKNAPATALVDPSDPTQSFESVLQQHQAHSEQSPKPEQPIQKHEPRQVDAKDKGKYFAEPVKPSPNQVSENTTEADGQGTESEISQGASENSDDPLTTAETSAQQTVEQEDSELVSQQGEHLLADDESQGSSTQAEPSLVISQYVEVTELTLESITQVVEGEPELEQDVDWLALIQQAEGQARELENIDDIDLPAELTEKIETELAVDDNQLTPTVLPDEWQSLSELLREAQDSGAMSDELKQRLASLFQQFSAAANHDQQAVEVTQQPELASSTRTLSEDELTLLADLLVADEAELGPNLLAAENSATDEQAIEVSAPKAPIDVDSQIVVEPPQTSLDILASLPEDKLDKALVELAAQVVSHNPIAQSALEKSATQTELTSQVNSLQAKTIAVPVTSEYADFISSLKAGIAEYKQQLEQGHQPGIDLTSLVSDAMQSSGQFSQLTSSSEKLEQQLRPFTQILDFTQSVSANLDAAGSDMGRRDLGAVTELGRVETRNQLSQGQFEKAVNITNTQGQQQLAERVRWMVGNNLQQADIRLDPPDLGTMQIKVSMHGDSASVSFVVQSQQARDMLDHAVPRLRELLGEKGIELGESQVRQQNQSSGEQSEQQGNGQFADTEQETSEDGQLHEQVIKNGSLGGIDYFV